MAMRDLFSIVFGKNQSIVKGQDLKMLNGYQARFTNYNGNLYDSSMIRVCIDTIARNGAKLSPKHIRSTDRDFQVLNKNIARLISEQPNEIDNAYTFYYKVISQLFLNNNAFIYIRRDANGVPEGLYPLVAGQYKLMEYKDEIYVQFTFRNGQQYTAPLNTDIIHLKRFYCEHDIIGGNNVAIIKAMSMKHIVQEGIINAIKATANIRGYLKTTKAMLKPEDVKNTRDQFVKDFISSSDGSGIAGLDATTDFTPVNMSPVTATDSQVKMIDDEIKSYFGLCDEIIMSKYNEDQWNAFYESVLEPIAVQMGMEFTNKLFSLTERFHGNQIVFEANRLQYASNTTKIKVAQYLNNYLTINEIREIFNLAPVEDGDKIMQDLNHINGDIADDYQGGNEDE